MLGMDHERLTFRYAGRDFRLTDVAGNVVKDVLAEKLAGRKDVLCIRLSP